MSYDDVITWPSKSKGLSEIGGGGCRLRQLSTTKAAITTAQRTCRPVSIEAMASGEACRSLPCAGSDCTGTAQGALAVGALRARSHCRSVLLLVHVTPVREDTRRPLFLRRRCGRGRARAPARGQAAGEAGGKASGRTLGAGQRATSPARPTSAASGAGVPPPARRLPRASRTSPARRCAAGEPACRAGDLPMAGGRGAGRAPGPAGAGRSPG